MRGLVPKHHPEYFHSPILQPITCENNQESLFCVYVEEYVFTSLDDELIE